MGESRAEQARIARDQAGHRARELQALRRARAMGWRVQDDAQQRLFAARDRAAQAVERAAGVLELIASCHEGIAVTHQLAASRCVDRDQGHDGARRAERAASHRRAAQRNREAAARVRRGLTGDAVVGPMH
jgi:hypothetical protein